MTATDLLRQDHRKMEKFLDRLMEQLRTLDPAVCDTIAAIQSLAAVHFAREEEIFYPALRPLAPDLLAQMDHQHEDVRELERHLAGLIVQADRDDRWSFEIRQYGVEFHDLIQHHIVDEEDHLLRVAEERLTRDTLCVLGRMMSK